MRKNAILVVILFSFFSSGFLRAQVFIFKDAQWGDETDVYHDGKTQVFICFYHSITSCEPGGKQNRYRFRLVGSLYDIPEKLIPYKFTYLNCEERKIEVNSTLNIGSSMHLGSNEGMDWKFGGQEILDINGKEVKQNPSSPTNGHPENGQLLVQGKLTLKLKTNIDSEVSIDDRQEKIFVKSGEIKRIDLEKGSYNLIFKPLNGNFETIDTIFPVRAEDLNGQYMFVLKFVEKKQNNIPENRTANSVTNSPNEFNDSALSANKLTLILKTQAACELSVDGENKINLKPGEVKRLYLGKGSYQLMAKSYNTDFEGFDTVYSVNELDLNKSMLFAIPLHQKKIAVITDTIVSVNNNIPSSPSSGLPEMVFVAGGSFQMGSDSGYTDEKPVHKVKLKSFYISKYEVTQIIWRSVTQNNPSGFNDFNGCDACPVEQVSYDDVQRFIKKLNNLTGQHYRLPTEAEWEFAARGGNKSKGYKYSGDFDINKVAWYRDNSGNRTNEVGKKQPNELGICDMSGNVWEWCTDWYDNEHYHNSSLQNPLNSEFTGFKVLRGGSWKSSEVSNRCYNRAKSGSDAVNNATGFRLAMDY